MRVLFVTHSAAMQGANLALLELAQELKTHYGVEPVVLMPRIHKNYSGHNLLLACRESRIECYSFPFYRFQSTTRWVQYVRCYSNLLFYPYIYLKFRKQHFDIIHSNGSVLSLGAFLSRLMKCPHVWHLREAGALHYGTKSLPGKWYEKWVYTHGDVFIAISQALKSYYSSIIPSDKIKLVYDGVRIPTTCPATKHDNMVFQFCMVGLVSGPKNQLDALKAVSVLVNEWQMTNLHFTVIGFLEPDYFQTLQSFVHDKGLGDYVTFLGERTDVGELLTGMDVGLILSKFEAFGRVTVEYMMHGLPVIASNTGANPEIVEDGITGLLCKLGNVQELASHMRTLMTDRETLLRFSANGRERAFRCFSVDQNAQQIYETYESVLASE